MFNPATIDILSAISSYHNRLIALSDRILCLRISDNFKLPSNLFPCGIH